MEVEQLERGSHPIVGVGASAGGLEALEKFFRHMPVDTGAAFVVVQHLDPQHRSILPELLARYTAMPVTAIQTGTPASANHVHVIPPNTELYVEKGILRLAEPSKPRGQRHPIDALFASLAQDLGPRSAAVVLSGTGTDGTQGLRAIKARGGTAIVQKPGDAAYPGMPASAADIADFILPASDMATAVKSFVAQCPQGDQGDQPDSLDPTDILRVLRETTGQDFGLYRRNTMVRRIQRRMLVTRAQSVTAYLERLRSDREEPQRLLDDLMINVTAFFRDSEAFESLTRDVLGPLVASQSELRIWVPGCASGEEAYSIAIAAFDAAERLGKRPRLQLFATDIDRAALATARQARYTAEVLGGMPPSLVGRYFINQGDGYVVVKDVRDACVFARHDVLRDPPFSKLDLVSCRNLLIYIEPPMQRRVFALFQHALRESGVLFLGSAENLPDGMAGFEPIDKKHRLYRRLAMSGRLPGAAPLPAKVESVKLPSASPTRPRGSGERGLQELVERAVRSEFAPACVVVDERGDIRYFWGNTGRIFPAPPGLPTTNVYNIVRPPLRPEVTTALTKCQKTRAPVIRRNLPVEIENEIHRVHLIARPLSYGDEHLFLLVVQELGQVEPIASDSDERTRVLENELLETQERLRASVEEVDSINEQLRASNEELQSANEELLSTNEELQTSQEELQSVNEELNTVNTELSKNVDELGEATAYLQNLFRSSQIATLFLDRNLRISRFTPPITALFSILESDIGRLITDFEAKFEAGDIAGAARAVLDDLTVRDRVVKRLEREQWFLMRLLPYRTVDESIEGVVVTFTDITDIKRAEQAVREAQQREQQRALELEAIMKAVPAAIWITRDRHAETIEGSHYSYELLRMPTTTNPSKSALDGRAPSHFRILHGGKELKTDELPLQRAAGAGEEIRGFEEEIVFRDGGAVVVYGNATPLRDAGGAVTGAVGAFIDITDLRATERALRTEQERFRASIDGLLDGFMLLVPVPATDGGVADFRVEYANRTAIELLGPSASVEGGLLGEIWASAELPSILHTCRDALATEGKLEQSIIVPGPEPSTVARAFDVRASRAGDRVAVSWHDVTSHKRTLAMLKDSHDRREEFLAVLGHELRNPLASIHNALHVLDRGSVESERAQRMHHLMRRQTGALTRLVDDLLEVSRIARNKIRLRPQLLELGDLLDDAIELHRPAFDQRSIDLVWRPAGHPLWVNGDPARLGQIVDNLLANALKFTDPGGRVEVELSQSAQVAALVVRDHGIGIDKETLRSLFVPFHQGKQSIDRPRGGLGLGLVLVKNLCEMHGGSVEVSSAGPGQGTQFIVRIPATQPNELVRDSSPQPSKRVDRVLIIEDNHDAAESLAEFVQDAWGVKVTIAFDGPTGIDKAVTELPDLVLCDVGLPGIDGFEVARRLRAVAAPAMFLVALTGYARDEDKARAREAGFDMHIAKPVETKDLERVLGCADVQAS